MNKFEKTKEYLLDRFNGLDKILEIEFRDEFSVVDINNKRSFIIVSIQEEDHTFQIRKGDRISIEHEFDDTKLFHIKNAKTIGFIPIDGRGGLMKLLKINKKRCDFVCFDETSLCFVEFKLNATSRNPEAFQKNRQEAINQLKNTIALFDSKLDKNYEELELEAYICTPKTYPRVLATLQTLQKKFTAEIKAEMNVDVYIRLFEQNEKICI
jgi:hypothetical protein